MYRNKDMGIGQVTPAFDINKAVRSNRFYAQKLGWQKYYDAILKFLGISGKPGESAFAEAVARWQHRKGLKPDGMIGPVTWNAIKSASVLPSPVTKDPYPRSVDITGRICHKLFNYDFGKDDLKPEHLNHINAIAKEIVTNYSGSKPIRTVYIQGHSGQEGNPDYNLLLGARRARRVHTALQNALRRQHPVISTRVLILRSSRGEKDAGDYSMDKQKRRVEVCLSTVQLKPAQPKANIFPDLRTTCMDDEIWQQQAAKCNADFNQCTHSNATWYTLALADCRGDRDCVDRVQNAFANVTKLCKSELMKCQERARYAAKKDCT